MLDVAEQRPFDVVVKEALIDSTVDGCLQRVNVELSNRKFSLNAVGADAVRNSRAIGVCRIAVVASDHSSAGLHRGEVLRERLDIFIFVGAVGIEVDLKT